MNLRLHKTVVLFPRCMKETRKLLLEYRRIKIIESRGLTSPNFSKSQVLGILLTRLWHSVYSLVTSGLQPYGLHLQKPAFSGLNPWLDSPPEGLKFGSKANAAHELYP